MRCRVRTHKFQSLKRDNCLSNDVVKIENCLQADVSIAQARQLPLQLAFSVVRSSCCLLVSIAQARQLPLQPSWRCYRGVCGYRRFNRSSATIASPTILVYRCFWYLSCFNRSSATIASPTLRMSQALTSITMGFNRSSATIASPTFYPCLGRHALISFNRSSATIASPTHVKPLSNETSMTFQSLKRDNCLSNALITPRGLIATHQVSIAQARQLPLQHFRETVEEKVYAEFQSLKRDNCLSNADI